MWQKYYFVYHIDPKTRLDIRHLEGRIFGRKALWKNKYKIMPIRTSNPKPDPKIRLGFGGLKPKWIDGRGRRWLRGRILGGIQLLHFQWLTNAEKNVIVSSSKNSSKRIVSNKRINKFKKSRRCETMLQVWWDWQTDKLRIWVCEVVNKGAPAYKNFPIHEDPYFWERVFFCVEICFLIVHEKHKRICN